MADTNDYKILNGPGKFDLFCSLSVKGYKEVTFTVRDMSDGVTRKMTGKINSVGIEDGSHESWLIIFLSEGIHYEGWYRTDGKREGYFNLKN